MTKVAKALIYDKDGRVLVLRRSETHPHYPHEADLVGGIIDSGETPLIAVVREIHEETGLTVSPGDLTPAQERTLPTGRHDFLFTCHLDVAQPGVEISWEHEAYEWIEAGKLKDSIDTTDNYMKLVKQYLEKAAPRTQS